MFTIVYLQDVSNASCGLLNAHVSSANKLLSISPELVSMGCPTALDKAINWAAMNHNLTLVSRKQTRMISRTMREMTITLKEA